MSIHIIGAGPTGLTLAALLQDTYTVHIYEKTNRVGGTWAPRPNTQKLFRQHSPQILSYNYLNTRKLFNRLGLQFKDYFTKESIGYFDLLKHATWSEKWLIIRTLIRFLLGGISSHVTVADVWASHVTPEFYQWINLLCYLVDGVSAEILTVNELLGSINQYLFYGTLGVKSFQFLEDWQQALNLTQWHFNNSLQELEMKNSKLILHFENQPIFVNSDDFVILALDPKSLLQVKLTGFKWNLQEVIPYIYDAPYSIQIHFDTVDFNLPETLTIMHDTEWNIIATIVLNQLISCVLFFPNAYSSRLKKSVKECTITEVQQEVLYQLNPWVNQKPRNITLLQGIGSATARLPIFLPTTTPIPQMFLAGPLTSHNFYPTSMEAAVETGIYVAKQINPKLKFRLQSPWTLGQVLAIVVILIISLFTFWMIKNIC